MAAFAYNLKFYTTQVKELVFMLSCSVFMGSESIYEKYQKFTVEEVSAWLIESGFPASTANKFKGEKVVYWILTLFSISNLCYIDYSIGSAVV